MPPTNSQNLTLCHVNRRSRPSKPSIALNKDRLQNIRAWLRECVADYIGKRISEDQFDDFPQQPTKEVKCTTDTQTFQPNGMIRLTTGLRTTEGRTYTATS